MKEACQANEINLLKRKRREKTKRENGRGKEIKKKWEEGKERKENSLEASKLVQKTRKHSWYV